MQIRRVRAYSLPFAFLGGGYRTSYGTRTHLNNLLIAIEAGDGLIGYGEIARRTGNSPEPNSSAMIQTVEPLLRQVLGDDPRAPGAVVAAMGPLSTDLSIVAAGVDTACLDLMAKATDLPLYDLLGGRRRDSVPCYHTVGQDTPENMAASAKDGAAQGHRVLQMKVGDTVDADCARVQAVLDGAPKEAIVLPDANGGWDGETARAVIGQFSDPRLLWEEPCATYELNRDLAELSGAKLVLDQCMKGLHEYARACVDGFAAGCGLKPGIQGGASAARIARDLCVAHDIALKIDDCWGADAITSASLHVALGVPMSPAKDLLLCGVDMRLYFDRRIAADGPDYRAPDFFPAQGAGLGITPDLEALGQPVIDIA